MAIFPISKRTGINMSCSLCKQPAVDSREFEGGNNAEFSMIMEMCETHFQEYEKDEFAFMDKYTSQIDDGCYERLIDRADALRDRAKYETVAVDSTEVSHE